MTLNKRIGFITFSFLSIAGLTIGSFALPTTPVLAKDSDSDGFKFGKFGLDLNAKIGAKFAEIQKKMDERTENIREKKEKKLGTFGENSSITHALGSTLEMHINDNGSVLVRGAKVQSVSGSTITATTEFGSTTLSWLVKTEGANFVGKGDGSFAVANIAVGDYISWNGSFDPSASALTVNAKTVKDWSAKKAVSSEDKHTFQGKLTAVASTTLPTTLGLLVGSNNYTVNVGTGTAILGANWGTVTLDKFKVGDTVRVFGGFHASSTSIIDASVVRDTNVD